MNQHIIDWNLERAAEEMTWVNRAQALLSADPQQFAHERESVEECRYMAGMHIATANALIAAGQKANMFWDVEDPERCYSTLHDAVMETVSNALLSVGDVIELQQAIGLPNIRVLITSVDNDAVGELNYKVM